MATFPEGSRRRSIMTPGATCDIIEAEYEEVFPRPYHLSDDAVIAQILPNPDDDNQETSD
jgi:hypothetical protein